MRKKVTLALALAVVVIAGGFAFFLGGADATPAAPAVPTSPILPVDEKRCYACHKQIAEFRKGSKHAGVNCISCHSDLAKHLANPKNRPVTRTDQKACATCHAKQYESFFAMNWKRPAKMEKSQLTGKSPNPMWDLLMMPHGFTREHNMQRSHAFMLIDHVLVDRAFGGRFVPKDGWAFFAQHGDIKMWDVLMDKFEGVDAHRPFMHGTGAFANTTCVLCKSTDHILDWPYMGAPGKGAKWDRTSKPYELVKELNHPMACFACHDPHSTRPRIVRDALIEALTRPEADTLWHKDPNRTGIEVYEMGQRGFTRKIAKLAKPDTLLLCGQCHVEYIGNPGIDLATGKPAGMADPRSNHFQFVDVWHYIQHHDDNIKWREFRHGVTGAKLTKIQHPDVEAFYNSPHHKAGVTCTDCHMPKMTDTKSGAKFTSHWQTNPRNYIKETCLQCHTGWTETQAKYVMDSTKNFLSGKKRKAEFWLMHLIKKFDEARAVGVDTAVLDKAREKHWHAHVHWEWWTAEVSGGFHHIEQARESLNTSMIRSQQAIMLLDDAIRAKRGTDTTFMSPTRAGAFIGVGPVRGVDSLHWQRVRDRVKPVK